MGRLKTKGATLFSNELSTVVSPEWFAVYTHSCQEKRVAGRLSIREIEYFLPVQTNMNHWKNGLRVKIERPLFPSYVFAKIKRTERVRVLELPGVHSIVGRGREPIPLPGDEIEALRRTIHLLNAEPHPYLNVGDRARIRSGPLEGMTGIIVRKKNGCRLVLSLDLIMKSVAVEVDGLELERVGPSANAGVLGVDARSAQIDPRLLTNSFPLAGSETL
jgi:transcription antitermination factor NusG